MTSKTNSHDLEIKFVHQFKRATRTPWEDKFRITWFFNPDTLDYIYEHKDENFRTNGFVLSDRLIAEIPDAFQKKYFLPVERCLLFLLFELQISQFINSDEVDDMEFEYIFGVSKARYFSSEAIDEWTEQIELL